MPSVFVSCALQDKNFYTDLADALGRAGFRIDTATLGQESIPFAPGDWINRRIEAADCIVLVWSRNAAGSPWVNKEVEIAIKAWSDDRLILARLDDTPLPTGLRDLTAIVVGQDREEAIASIAQAAFEHAPPARLAPAPASYRAPEPPAASVPPPMRRSGLPAVAASVMLVLALGSAGIATFWHQPPERHWQEPPPLRPGTPEPKGEINAPPPPSLAPASPGLSTGSFWLLAALLASGAAVVWALQQRASTSRATLPPAPKGDAAPHAASAPVAPRLHDIFISYSRQDSSTVDRLVARIEEAGYKVWIDRAAQGAGGQRFAGPIVRAIKSSRLVALMCSANSFQSDHVVREVYVAGNARKPSVAFQLDSAELPDELEYFLTGFPRIPAPIAEPAHIRSEISRLVS